MDRKRASSVASAVAFMFSAAAAVGCTNETMDEGDVDTNAEPLRCQGINECAGTSECASADDANDCQGQNECAGMGWVTVESEEECTSEGGTILS